MLALLALCTAVVGSGASAWSRSPHQASAQAVSVNCSASPHSCGYPDATNTGVAAGTTLANSKTIRVARDNEVVQNVSIHNGTIDVSARNVVIRNVKVVIDSPELWAIIVRPGASATIDHVDVSGVDALHHSVEYAVLSQTTAAVRISHANLHNCSACVQGENVTASANYVHDVSGGGTGIQCSSNAGCGLTATGNTVLSRGTAVGLFGDFGTPRNSTVDGNLLGGGGFSVYAGTAASTNIHIDHNRFSRAVFGNGGRWGPVTGYHPNPGNTMIGNIWDDTGAPLSCPGCLPGASSSPSTAPSPTPSRSTSTASRPPSSSSAPTSTPPTPTPTQTTSAAPPPSSSSSTANPPPAPPAPPAPVPAGTVGCAASPHSCGYPDATNTGVTPGTTLTPSGSVSVSTDNQVVQNLSITNGTIDISAKNVTIRNVRITRDSPVLWAIIVRGGASAKIEHVDISGVDGGSHSVEYGVLSQSQQPVEVSYSHMWQCQDCIQGSYGIYAHDNFLEDNAYVPGAHLDGFQCDGEGGCHVTVQHNTVLGTGIAIALYGDFGTPVNSTFDDNLVRGGSYSIYGGISSSTGIHITNNRIARNSQFPAGGIWGPFGYCFPNAAGAVFSGNVWDDTGKSVEP